ncbi:hypothetical protein, partial [Priestia koreensis]|uniref:hypothetical protein n=1 Tax=Priestia koreensis TaxID=284581 RepID=UPI00203DDD03
MRNVLSTQATERLIPAVQKGQRVYRAVANDVKNTMKKIGEIKIVPKSIKVFQTDGAPIPIWMVDDWYKVKDLGRMFSVGGRGTKGTGNAEKGNSDLLDNTGRFKDAELQTKYDLYCDRKYKNGEAPKEPLEWKKASEKWASLKEQGQEFSDESFNLFSQQYENAEREITIVTHEGTKVRVDAIASDEYGNVIIQEYKSTTTAPYTTNQEKGFPELKNSGGAVVGEGKGDFSRGYEVPSGTRPQIVRPEGTSYFDE